MSEAKFTITKLNGTNWQTWKVRIEMLLQREDLWDVVEKVVPEENARNDKWVKIDRKAKATIILSIEDNQLPLVKNSVFAHDVFAALQTYHQKTTRSVRVSLLKRLCATNLSEHDNLEDHLREIDDLFDRLDAAGTVLDTDIKICMVMRSLPPSYDGIVVALDNRADDDISVDIVKSKLMDEFHRRLERDNNVPKREKALRSVDYKTKDTRLCHFCKKPGHLRRDCRKYKASLKDAKSAGYEKENSKAKAVQSQERNIAFTGSDKINPSAWIIDSGASAHMANDRNLFVSLKNYSGGWITLADGNKTQILGEGCCILRGVDDRDKLVNIEMKDVKYVPGLATSLISVVKLAEKKLKVDFNDKGCRIINANGKVAATGFRYGGLYYLRTFEESCKSSLGEHNVNCQHQWHRRLGHRDWAAAERVIKEKLATGIKVSDCGLRLVCECCLEGKSARQPFPSVSERKSNQVLDIVHTDLCGPMKTITPSGNRYVMHLIDDYSRYTMTYLLKHKSEAIERIKDYVRWTETLFRRKVCVIRSDGGGEFNNNELKAFYRSEGIKPQFSTPYSPQQNGVAERKNRSITEMATCMLIDADMDKRYWGEAVLTATYLQNRLPSRSLHTTPHELWWGRKPDFAHLRVFGTEAYVHVPEPKRSKLDSKSRKLRFVGYSTEHKAYRFVDCQSDLITISRDARFLELGNGTSTIDFLPSGSVRNKHSVSIEEDIKLLPIKEEIKEDNLSDAENYEDAVDEEQIQRDVQLPRSTRGMVPRHLDDYVLDYAVDTVACATQEPVNYEDAVKDVKWRVAMEDELKSLHQNNTWELVPLPKGKNVVGSKWVFKLKRDEEGQIVKHKARVVAQGYVQKYGHDFDEVYAPVTRHATFRTFLTVAAKQKMTVKHLDIKTAYLNGFLDEEVYMRQPPGYKEAGKEKLVCRLKKSIYGLRQSARCWNKCLHNTLTKLGFKQSYADQCLYSMDCGHTRVFLLVYVDDMLLASTDDNELQKVFRSLSEKFELTCLGDVRCFLGLEVRQDEGVYKIRLQNYIEELLKIHGMSEAKPAKTPMDPGYLKDKSESKPMEDDTKFKRVVGSLLYISVVARPDIANSAAILGRKFSNPTEADWTAAKRVLRYLKRTKNYNLCLGGMLDEPLSGYSDADWAGDLQTRRSTSGFVFMFGGATISWASRGQTSVTLSSMEAEYVALSEACQEAIWLRKLLADFLVRQTKPTIIREDNQGCLAFVRTERFSRRSKHIDTREKFVQELCEKDQIALEYCSTELMIADLFTKPLGPTKHDRLCGQLHLE